MQVDNTIKKPQISWWTSIDNSYFPFIPLLDSKPNGKYPLPKEITLAQLDKQNNPNKYRYFAFGDHNLQKNEAPLPHPYLQELEDFEEEIKDREFSLTITPTKYDHLENIPFMFVDTKEKMEIMKENLM